MEPVITLNLIALWLVVLLLLWLLLRLIRAKRAADQAAVPALAPGKTEPLRGQRAPEFTAFTLDQQRVTHADYFGHETLFILLSTGCQHCRNVLPEIERVGQKLRQRGTQVALVFAASADKVRAYCEEMDLTLPVLVAPSESTPFVRDYNRSRGVPAFVAINSEGIVTHEGVVNRHEEAWRTLIREWQAYPILTKSATWYR
ncbi:MAG: TlpA family protein disulfide reductase [Ktedonobacteraceae bacterium]|nr:TlpA family protein disulfide reductase [Ktedonobacteraceae bacterium]